MYPAAPVTRMFLRGEAVHVEAREISEGRLKESNEEGREKQSRAA